MVPTMITATTTTIAPSPKPMYQEVASADQHSVASTPAVPPCREIIEPALGVQGPGRSKLRQVLRELLDHPSVTAAITPSPICAALPVTLICE